jgi:hypothetical protein
MPLRNEHNALRPTTPRAKDVHPRPVRSPYAAANHAADGRFRPGNTASSGKRLKQIIKRHLGKDATDDTVSLLFAETKSMFLALVKAVDSTAPQVQDTLARRARWGVLSAHYALLAAELGLDTPDGQKALEMALKLDARAERLDVTAIDLANKLEGIGPQPESGLERIQREGREAEAAYRTRKAVEAAASAVVAVGSAS